MAIGPAPLDGGGGQLRIELGAAASPHLAQHLVDAVGPLVGADHEHGIDRVGQADHAGAEGIGQPVGVAGTVPPLMVMANQQRLAVR